MSVKAASLRLPEPGDVNRVVPATGLTAILTACVAAAMAFLAVFALALLFATDRLAARWSSELADTATLRITAPQSEMEARLSDALRILEQTPGVTGSRVIDDDEARALLAPWFGEDVPLETLPMPRLVEVTRSSALDAEGLRLRLEAEAPGALLDDHTRWRAPLITAAGRLRLLGWLATALIAGSLAAMVTLAASASLEANARVIDVLRLIGAHDRFVVRAFTRRFTLRALAGAALGTAVGTGALWAVPSAPGPGQILTDLGFQGSEWLAPIVVPLAAGVVAYTATRIAALRRLREMR